MRWLTMAVITDVILTLALVTRVCANIAGQLNVISQNESIDLYNVTLSGSVSSVFSAQLELNLRPLCPSCHTSYNLISFDDQVLIPSTGSVTIFTFTFEEPYVYTQSVLTPDCEPLSLVRSSQALNQLFLDCEDLANEENYFLAELELSSDSTGRQQWTFEKLSGFETFEQPGSFVEVFTINSIMMLYAHQNNDYIEVNGFLSGYINLLSRPDDCSRVVRITATSGDLLLLECSSDASELVSGLHLLALDLVISTHLLDTAPYTVCPMRFTQDGDFAAIFTEHYILVIDLVSHIFTNISVNQAIYDGVITQSEDDSLYLVFTTLSGLHRAYLTIERGSDIKVINRLLFPDSGTVCAELNCPLLTLIDSDTVLVALELDITIFSISGLHKVAPNIRTKYQPSIIVFQKKISSPLPSVTSHTPLSQTQTSITLLHPPRQTAEPPKDGYGVRETQGEQNIIIISVVVVMAVVIVFVVVVVILRLRRCHHVTKLPLVTTRYVCSSNSDAVQLLCDDDAQSDNHREEDKVSEVEPEKLEDDVETEVILHEDDEVTNQQLRATREAEEEVEEEQHSTQEQKEDQQSQTHLQQYPKRPAEAEFENIRGGTEDLDDHLPETCKDSPTVESMSDSWASSRAVYAQETNYRCGEHQQQVVGSLTKEAQEVRESPDGSAS